MKAKPQISNPPLVAFEHKRDAYGFAVRPQHVQRYREYANIYREEEEERSDRWKNFLERQSECAQLPVNGSSAQEQKGDSVDGSSDKTQEGDDGLKEPKAQKDEASSKTHRAQIWAQIRPSLRAIEDMMNARVKKKINATKTEKNTGAEEDSEDEFYDLERSESDPISEVLSTDGAGAPAQGSADVSPESSIPWKQELEFLVQGGVPMAVRGELWQAFVGVKARHVKNYYQNLLLRGSKNDNSVDNQGSEVDEANNINPTTDSVHVPEKWKLQIEKDLPRTFPGHPALDEGGRDALRRILTAYARHNPSVGYCQAMNFFAALLLLLMPEENAFWALLGILDDYFEGYYSEEMIESQVDQLVFEELVRERFPKLVNHLDYLGVQVAWVSGPWFLSIFMNILPWESVLRVWDVLLFQGNRVMLFRTALALMELYGPALVTTKDAGDAVTLLQSLAGSTFDSSQLVLTACMGYPNVYEERLQELRNKHRPAVQAAHEERSKGQKTWRDSQGLSYKLYGFKENKTESKITIGGLSRINSESSSTDGDSEINPVPDLQEQMAWLKNELCKELEEKRSAIVRAEELETALMEMVQEDNRRELSAKVEQLEKNVADLQQALSDKQEQESAMLQVLMRVEQEQKVTEDARRYAEQDAAAQRYATEVLQEKYETASATLAEMEKRVVMAETMLEATLQYQSGQTKAQPSPRSTNQDSSAIRTSQELSQEIPPRKISLLSRPFGLGWRDKNKAKPAEEPADVKATIEEQSPKVVEKPVIEQVHAKIAGDEQNAKVVQEDENGDQMEQVSLADDGK
ncbi:putative Rab-GTPase-TBC domain-containing protein [Helianthus annuus]|uniref:Rab-GTPase-TBC domain-containing protein n=1 Tax=Helianthus annuus TaxID=4232 RepID=A0A251SLX0_HELAN|nr:rab GTPase-activating protein 1 [Helianthus annuus]KAF5770818.1 putative Rab-GTPase-TBC domain-containing protein [Helianthus annuus]KAJ0470559.1 putative Rab-GTPase-TBC domain-containing protein [Helianthus annuus]KAJ0842019.1 putative Rab-GTPase-TBC domain-containing protein [Helianthus annuus]KAJ0855566.1 putative Rab-GTPase-TBC domain-containing protein [Helianthus annuus]